MRTRTSSARSARRRAARRTRPGSWVKCFTPERAARLERTTRALWVEMKQSLRRMQIELRSCGSGDEVPVLQSRVRVKMMAAVLEAMDGDLRALRRDSAEGGHGWLWLGELEQVMDRWVNLTVWDLKDHGTVPDRADANDERYFTRGYASAVGSLFEAYRDWGFTARWLSTLDFHSEVTDLQRSDEEMARIRLRLGIRRKFRRDSRRAR